jgi:prephenate dehydratase
VDTVINITQNEDSAFSTLHIKTLDRPGLLVEIVKVLKDINVNVISAEVRPAALDLQNWSCSPSHACFAVLVAARSRHMLSSCTACLTLQCTAWRSVKVP